MIPHRKPWDGTCSPNWGLIGALAATAAFWALVAAAATQRPDPVLLAMIAFACAYAALCMAAAGLMAWALGVLILDTVVEPLVRRFTRTPQ